MAATLVPFKAQHGLKLVKTLPSSTDYSLKQWKRVCELCERIGCGCTILDEDESSPLASAVVFVDDNKVGTLTLLLDPRAPVNDLVSTIGRFLAVAIKSQRLVRIQTPVTDLNHYGVYVPFLEALGFSRDSALANVMVYKGA